jgi:hypothetical protein
LELNEVLVIFVKHMAADVVRFISVFDGDFRKTIFALA